MVDAMSGRYGLPDWLQPAESNLLRSEASKSSKQPPLIQALLHSTTLPIDTGACGLRFFYPYNLCPERLPPTIAQSISAYLQLFFLDTLLLSTMAGGAAKYRHLSRKSSHRQALLRNLVTSLFKHESITTTWAKAKEAQRLAEKLITLGKKNTPASRKRALEIFYVCGV